MGIRCNLIQSNDGFPLRNLAEIRCFLHRLDQEKESTLIDEETWKQARAEMTEEWSESALLPVCLRIVDSFARVNRRKYRRELEEYLMESDLQDFQGYENGQVTVSTIHKAKGREFDHVILLLTGNEIMGDEDRRRIYVGITRAKKSLEIHTTLRELDGLYAPGVKQTAEDTVWDEPETILLQLTHRDVILGFFRGKNQRMLQCRAGMKLQPVEDGLQEEGGTVLIRYSVACRERLEKLRKRGYRIREGEIRCIVA